MKASEVRKQLRLRAESGVPGIDTITADETGDWPEGLLDALQREGALSKLQPAETVTCTACLDDHIEPVQYIEEPLGTPPRAYIACPETGRVAVDTQRMRRWQIVERMAAGSDGGSEATNGQGSRQGRRLQHSPDYQSVSIGAFHWPLNEREAKTIEILHRAYEAGARYMAWRDIQIALNEAGYTASRMRDIVRQIENSAGLIVSPRRGFYGLNL